MNYKNFYLIDDSGNGGLFKLVVGGDKANLINDNNSKRKVRVVSNTSDNNGVESYIYNDAIGIKNCITIGTRGNDYFSCYQDDYTVTIVRTLLLYTQKFKLNKYIAFYICALLRKNKYKCTYGRVLSGERIKIEKIRLPVDGEGNPDWVFIEEEIKPKYEVIYSLLNTNSYHKKKISLNSNVYKYFYIDDLFDEIKPTKGNTTDELIEGNEIPYIAAKKTNNGLDMMCSKEDNEHFISKGNCIVFIHIGAGSAGYTTYQENNFIGMNGKTSCGYNDRLNKYNALFLVAILDQERPKYSFGRSWTGDRLLNTKIKLPSKQNSKGEYEPDWQFMEDYIKSLPYSSNL